MTIPVPLSAAAPEPLGAMGATRDRAPFHRWLGYAGLFALAIAVYFPVFHAGFIWNDRDYVTSPQLRSVAGLGKIWFQVGATEQYYPVLHSAFWLEHRWWGEAAAGYHWANVLLHAASACFLVVIMRRLAIPGAWLAAALFVVHPVFVESVAWIAEQKNTLSTAFYLLALLFYVRFDEGRARRYYALASICFGLALLSKSVTATLPAAWLVIVWWRRGRIEARRDIVPLIPWFLAGAGVGLFTAWVEKTYLGAEGAEFGLSLLQRVLLAPRIVWFYFRHLGWPLDLTFIYPRWQIDTASASSYVPLAMLVGAIAGLWGLRRHGRAPLAVALFFVGSLFPVLGFFNVYGFVFSYVADHWQYLPSLGVIVGVSAALARVAATQTRAVRTVAVVVAALALAGLGSLGWRQCLSYNDVERFYRTIITENPDCWMAYNNLGSRYAEAGRTADAIPLFEKALQLKPDNADAEDNLGSAFRVLGRDRDALEHYRTAVRLRPKFVAARLHFAAMLDASGQSTNAIAQYEEALRLMPDSPEVWNDLGTVFVESERFADAAHCYERAVALKPDFAGAHSNLGSVWFRLGRLAEAIAEEEKAVQLQPDYADAHTNLGMALAESKRVDAAIAQFRIAAQLQPTSAVHHANLGRALLLANRPAEAEAEFERARALMPARR